MHRHVQPRTRSIANLSSPPQLENKEEHSRETVCELVLHAYKPQPKPQRNPNTHQEPIAMIYY